LGCFSGYRARLISPCRAEKCGLTRARVTIRGSAKSGDSFSRIYEAQGLLYGRGWVFRGRAGPLAARRSARIPSRAVLNGPMKRPRLKSSKPSAMSRSMSDFGVSVIFPFSTLASSRSPTPSLTCRRKASGRVTWYFVLTLTSGIDNPANLTFLLSYSLSHRIDLSRAGTRPRRVAFRRKRTPRTAQISQIMNVNRRHLRNLWMGYP